ncbi:LacI family transcriptional regulator [Bifidobacterium callitrichos]|uniref:LacI family transcriptional regulator n=1 Tax=Bifidobacterium callitrichos TaxID=762209 RepID=A0A5M9ZBS3_9BIFI|nr:LacI family DNA-binding transcriptional regulator [Bifidobacterium callitrichos]KAA8815984.1 LacI family transcriptional regulator [Bifidobacterium callitrichos]
MGAQNDKTQSPATLMDVAKAANVSIATASRVLNGSTRRVRNQSYVKVMEAATKLNYRPNAYAQAVAKGTAPNIVLLVSDISDPYFAAVSQGVVKAAAEHGLTVTISVAPTPREELEAVRKATATRPRGIIIAESEYVDAPERGPLTNELRQYESTGGRAVFILNRDLPFPAVDVANDVGARAIARLIIDFGYTRPMILRGDETYRTSRERLDGVLAAFADAGVAIDPRATVNGRFNRTEGYAAIMQMARAGLLKPGDGALYEGRGVDSVIALNDVMAIGAMTALRANGIEPGIDVGVTGFGDIPYSADVYPSLTTVHLPLEQMGQAAVGSVLAKRDAQEVKGDGTDSGSAAAEPATGRLIYVQSAPDVVLRGSLPRK